MKLFLNEREREREREHCFSTTHFEGKRFWGLVDSGREDGLTLLRFSSCYSLNSGFCLSVLSVSQINNFFSFHIRSVLCYLLMHIGYFICKNVDVVVCAYIYACMDVCVSMYLYLYSCIYMCVCVLIYVCVLCVYIYGLLKLWIHHGIVSHEALLFTM